MAASAHSTSGAGSSSLDADLLVDLGLQVERTGSTSRMDVRCSACGYGAVVKSMPSRCPMCTGSTWDFADWSPLAAARRNP